MLCHDKRDYSRPNGILIGTLRLCFIALSLHTCGSTFLHLQTSTLELIKFFKTLFINFYTNPHPLNIAQCFKLNALRTRSSWPIRVPKSYSKPCTSKTWKIYDICNSVLSSKLFSNLETAMQTKVYNYRQVFASYFF